MGDEKTEWCRFCDRKKPNHFGDYRRIIQYKNGLHIEIRLRGMNGYICEDCGYRLLKEFTEIRKLVKENVLSKPAEKVSAAHEWS